MTGERKNLTICVGAPIIMESFLLLDSLKYFSISKIESNAFPILASNL